MYKVFVNNSVIYLSSQANISSDYNSFHVNEVNLFSLFLDLELYPETEVIAGVATGAIGIGMLVADALDLPFIYIRPEAKKHGRQNQIEGIVPEGKNVVVIEDLISTGKSSLAAVEALKKCKANLLGMVAIFSYGFEVADQNFAAAEVKLNTLSNYENLITLAEEQNYINQDQVATLKDWRTNPSQWNQ